MTREEAITQIEWVRSTHSSEPFLEYDSGLFCSQCCKNLRIIAGLSLETPMEIVMDKLKEEGLWI